MAVLAETPFTIPRFVEALSDRYGERPWVIDDEGEHSFQSVRANSLLIAANLSAHGIMANDRVGLLMGNSAAFLSTMLAVQRLGAIAVLLPTLAREEELAWLINHSEVTTMIIDARVMSTDIAARAANAVGSNRRSGRLTPSRIFVRGASSTEPEQPYSRLLCANALATCDAFPSQDDCALTIYTSGSTAAPKAVLHSHGAVVRQAQAMCDYMAYETGERVLSTQPLFWVGGLCTTLLAAAVNGAATILPPDNKPETMLDWALTHRADYLAMWPAQLAQLQTHKRYELLAERLKPNSAQQLGLFGITTAERTPNSLGMTETFGPHSMELPGAVLPPGETGSFGRAVPGFERKIIDPETGECCKDGEIGEIAVKGHSMMLGLFKAEVAPRFSNDGFLLTGDLGWISKSGHLHFSGRLSGLIKHNGANVSPAEVEQVLRAIDGVEEAIVIGMPDIKAGEIPVAVVAPLALAHRETEIGSILSDRLASYKVPRRFVFVDRADIPRTQTAKADLPALRVLASNRL